MTRRSVFRVLLSLVLLLSQQMAMSHALSHWTSQTGGPVARKAANDTELSSAFAQDRSCAQCLGLAQLSSPLADSPRQFAPPQAGASAFLDAGPRAADLARARAFDSRAPPFPG